MNTKYFTVKVKPLVPASEQNNGAYAAGDLLADWFAFDMPKGGAALRSVTAIIRGNDGSAQNQAHCNLSVFFANPKADGSAPGSLGTGHATANGTNYFNDIVGGVFCSKNGVVGAGNSLDRITVLNSGEGSSTGHYPHVILEGRPHLTRDGYNTVYVGLVSGSSGTYNFSSGVINAGAVTAGATSLSVDDGSGGDASTGNVFNVGDILHSETDDVIGEIETIGAHSGDTNVATITIVSGTGGHTDGDSAAVADNEELYNPHPITLILNFER
jgi:hypothetical protein|tara:strand:- start:70 stop:882 length:813 start_codon:yes stop_codon:yes gene_type:complete